jgi:hypothetical protein
MPGETGFSLSARTMAPEFHHLLLESVLNATISYRRNH